MTTGSESLTMTRTFNAPRERVFAAFTDPAMFAQWWGPPGTTNADVEIDASVGGRYATRMHMPPGMPGMEGAPSVLGLSGEFTEIEAQRTIAYTFQWEGQELITQVTISLEDAPGGGTLLTLRHEGFPAPEYLPDHEHGWGASFDRLAQALA